MLYDYIRSGFSHMRFANCRDLFLAEDSFGSQKRGKKRSDIIMSLICFFLILAAGAYEALAVFFFIKYWLPEFQPKRGIYIRTWAIWLFAVLFSPLVLALLFSSVRIYDLLYTIRLASKVRSGRLAAGKR